VPQAGHVPLAILARILGVFFCFFFSLEFQVSKYNGQEFRVSNVNSQYIGSQGPRWMAAMARSPLGALLLLAVAAAAAGTAGAAGADSARFEDLYLGDFSLDPDSHNRPTPAHKQPTSQQLSAPSYPACISLCSSQKRAMRRQELAQRKKAGGARMVGKGKSDNIAALEAKEQEIRHRLKELRRQKRAAAHAAHRKLLTVENTADDDERASRLAEFAKADSDKTEAAKIKRLLAERKKLLGYLQPSKLASKQDDSFQKRLNSLPFSVAGETDCVQACKQARSSSRPRGLSAKGSAKTHMLPTSSDPPFVYQGGHDDCDAGGMMIMPPDFPVRVVNKGDCATCSSVCSTMKFSSPWMRDGRGSCGVRAESDTLDRYMRNFNGRVTMNLCTPLKGYGNWLTGEPTVNGFNGDIGYVGAPAHTMYEDYMSKNLGCCGQNQVCAIPQSVSLGRHMECLPLVRNMGLGLDTVETWG